MGAHSPAWRLAECRWWPLDASIWHGEPAQPCALAWAGVTALGLVSLATETSDLLHHDRPGELVLLSAAAPGCQDTALSPEALACRHPASGDGCVGKGAGQWDVTQSRGQGCWQTLNAAGRGLCSGPACRPHTQFHFWRWATVSICDGRRSGQGLGERLTHRVFLLE